MFGGVRTSLGVLAAAAGAGVVVAGANGQVDPNSGIDFMRIGAVGNAPWAGNGTPGDLAVGRGRVDYQYSIGRFEWTTAQAVEFFNAAFDRPQSDWLPHLIPPDHWGAAPTTPHTPGGLRWTVPAGREMIPVGSLSWRMAAMVCNWYQNNKSLDRSAFLSGAYDVSTFGYNGNAFTDQPAHTPGARYWIPTLDETIKAFHYDPNRNGPGQGGYWIYSITRDTAPVGGPPPSMGGHGDANFGWDSSTNPGLSPFNVPLGAYSVTSPWGLFDTSGGTAEWTESIQVSFGQNRWRYIDGSAWTDSPGNVAADAIMFLGSESPSISTYDLGFRIASSVPAPASCVAVCSLGLVLGLRRRR